MDKSFFENLIGREVHITYKDGSRESFTDGTVKRADDDIIVIMNSDCVIAVRYESITSCRTKANEDENP